MSITPPWMSHRKIHVEKLFSEYVFLQYFLLCWGYYFFLTAKAIFQWGINFLKKCGFNLKKQSYVFFVVFNFEKDFGTTDIVIFDSDFCDRNFILISHVNLKKIQMKTLVVLKVSAKFHFQFYFRYIFQKRICRCLFENLTFNQLRFL